MDNHREYGQDDQAGYLSADSADNDMNDDAVMDDSHGFGTDERRMHVRAYNHWVMLLGEKSFPSVDDLDLETLDDFVPNSVLLDFTSGIENPAITHIGSAVAQESGIDEEVGYVSQIPGRSLLSRITDHYMEILANQAPIGFEAEFVNQLGKTIMYRGILLPFSSDDDTIDFVYGVINWKMLADKSSTDELLLEVEQAMADKHDVVPDNSIWDLVQDEDGADADHVLPNVAFGAGVNLDDEDAGADLPFNSEDASISDTESGSSIPSHHGLAFSASVSSELLNEGSELQQPEVPVDEDTDVEPEPDENADLSEWLKMAQSQAEKAAQSESRSRSALYRAIGLAYDVSLVAEREPQSLEMALDQAGIVAQERAPMTPIVKLVFGSEYDKTRLTEYASALSYAHRRSLSIGKLPEFLNDYDGGLKGVVREERRLRRPEGNENTAVDVLAQNYQQMRDAEPLSFDEIDLGDEEFGVVVVRRNEAGHLVVAKASMDRKITDMVVRKLAP